MKRFEYESTVAQLDEVLEYSKSPFITTATKKELEHFLSVLRRHFSEVAIGNPRYRSYQGAVQHIESLMASKQSDKYWYERPFGILLLMVLAGIIIWVVTKLFDAYLVS